MCAQFAWIVTIVVFGATAAAGADTQDCTTPSMSDETSLLQTSSNIKIRPTQKDNVLHVSDESKPEHEELEPAVSEGTALQASEVEHAVSEAGKAKKSEHQDSADGSKLPDRVAEVASRPAEDLDSTHSVVTDLIMAYKEPAKTGAKASFGTNGMRIVLQLLFAVLYFLIFVSNRPIKREKYEQPNQAAQDNFAMGPLAGCLEGGLPNCVCGWICSAPHAARTFHFTNTCNYWAGCCCMAICPCITLFWAHSCTALEARLGGPIGQKENICVSGLCAFFCSCCVIAHDAGSLDKLYEQKTGFCGYLDP